MARWEHFSHGSDIGVRGFGESIEEAFEQAAVALTAVVADISCVELRAGNERDGDRRRDSRRRIRSQGAGNHGESVRLRVLCFFGLRVVRDLKIMAKREMGEKKAAFEPDVNLIAMLPLWQLDIVEVAGHNIEAHGREEVNRLLQNGWLLLHIYTLKYHEDGVWRERPMAILGRVRNKTEANSVPGPQHSPE